MSKPALLTVAALAMVATLPGRTQGLGLITEPLLADLGLSRVSFATLNFWATIVGALGAVGVGRLIDRFGARPVVTVTCLALAIVVAAMSRAEAFFTLAILVTLTRALGQSALSVVSIAMVGRRVATDVDRAMAIYSILLSVGFMLAFPLVGAVVQSSGWRAAWLAVAFGVLMIGLIAALTGRDMPADRKISTGNDVLAHGDTLPTALRTPAFWVFAIGTSLYGLVASGIGLFNESILAERGFSAAVYHQALAVTAITALGGNFLGGWLAGRAALTRLMAGALAALAAGVGALPLLASFGQVMVWAGAMGISGGMVTVLFFSGFPRVFGRRHLGRIQGVAQAMTVLASAIGPVVLARGVEATGSYAAVFWGLALVITAVALAALLCRVPRSADAPAGVSALA